MRTEKEGELGWTHATIRLSPVERRWQNGGRQDGWRPRIELVDWRIDKSTKEGQEEEEDIFKQNVNTNSKVRTAIYLDVLYLPYPVSHARTCTLFFFDELFYGSKVANFIFRDS